MRRAPDSVVWMLYFLVVFCVVEVLAKVFRW